MQAKSINVKLQATANETVWDVLEAMSWDRSRCAEKIRELATIGTLVMRSGLSLGQVNPRIKKREVTKERRRIEVRIHPVGNETLWREMEALDWRGPLCAEKIRELATIGALFIQGGVFVADQPGAVKSGVQEKAPSTLSSKVVEMYSSGGKGMFSMDED